MAARFRRNARAADIWPGFVDALSTLLLVLIFLLVIFVIAEYFLGRVLSGRETELAQLKNAVFQLESLLSGERERSDALRGDLDSVSARLAEADRDREELRAERVALLVARDALTRDRDALAALIEDSYADAADADELRLLLAETQAALAAARAEQFDAVVEAERSRDDLAEERRLSAETRSQMSLLNAQIARLRAQLGEALRALEASEATVSEQELEIEDLGGRLNLAMARRVRELELAGSEFFGRLREALSGRSDVRIDGDRFVIQSGVLFTSGSDELGAEGLGQVADLAGLLIQIAREIPDDVNWVLRIDGHTDKRPINTERFRSNWALSSARAITVARALIDNGVPPRRLMAAGFGEFQPIDDRETEDAFRRNRRIELKLTQR